MRFLANFFIFGTFAMDSTMLMLLMQQNAVQNPGQANQMNMILPFLMMDDFDSQSGENSELLMMMMMQGGNMGDMNSILPLLMLGDDSLDFKSLFLLTNMMKQGMILRK